MRTLWFLWAPWGNPEQLPHLKIFKLITTIKLPLSQVLGIRTWASLWSLFSLPPFALWPTDSHLTHAEYVHPIPSFLKLSTHFNIYSNLKSHLSFMRSKVLNLFSESSKSGVGETLGMVHLGQTFCHPWACETQEIRYLLPEHNSGADLG